MRVVVIQDKKSGTSELAAKIDQLADDGFFRMGAVQMNYSETTRVLQQIGIGKIGRCHQVMAIGDRALFCQTSKTREYLSDLRPSAVFVLQLFVRLRWQPKRVNRNVKTLSCSTQDQRTRCAASIDTRFNRSASRQHTRCGLDQAAIVKNFFRA